MRKKVDPPTRSERLEAFSAVEVFHGVPRDVIERLAEESTFVFCPESTDIYSKDSTADAVYIVVKGLVAMRTQDRHFMPVQLEWRGQYSHLGMSSLITGEPRSMTARADSDCYVLRIRGGDFMAVVDKFPVVTKNVLRHAMRRVADQGERLEVLRQRSTDVKVAYTILRRYNSQPRRHEKPTGNTISEEMKARTYSVVDVSVEDIGEELGIDANVVTKSLSRLMQAGLMARVRRRVLGIPDEQALVRFCKERSGTDE